MTDGRKRLLCALSALCITTGAPLLTAVPSHADPTARHVRDVRDEVQTLYHQAEQASERVNDARIRLDRARHRLQHIRVRVHGQRVRYHDTRSQVVAVVQAQVEGSDLVTASQLVLADDPDAFIEQITTVDQYALQQAELTDQLAEQSARLDRRQAHAHRVVDAMAADRTRLAGDKAEIDRKAEAADALLARLVEQRRQAREAREAREARQAEANQAAGPVEEDTSRAAPRSTVTSAPASGNAAAAVQFALAQVGDAYVYGAAGPSAFDCSGLTMSAWGAAGVGLPHSSSAQTGYGTPVSMSSLQPGDLVFYYSPISHVAMYIGNGMIVHAANPSQGVRVDPVGLMPFAGAVRPG